MATPLPAELVTVRVLLFVFAGLTAALTLLGIALSGADAYTLGYFTVFAAPGAIALALALRLPKGRRPLFWSIIAWSGLVLLLALSNLAETPSAFVQMLIPGLTLYFVTRKKPRARLR
ncbi:hypothetical protein [Allonocardiopsis opalescens]|uniref:Uncharacterized protein n=1 Tax=Allonocardiopsis opalescens TaxID=1144618 RepID=A0A2T0PUD2_9ACTN|nr:hypothetical protein [Allonocardiopsis opalescens]PRX92408.1 hypothetical protein CLV72_110168 [Allonocardiopsis opalescens]